MPKRLKSPVAAFMLTALLGAAVTYGVYRAEHGRARSEFDSDLAAAATLIQDRIGRDIAYLNATRAGLVANKNALNRASFAAYVAELGLSGRDLGLQGLGFAQLVEPSNEGAIQARMLQDYGATQGIWPEAGPDFRTAIILLEPADARNRAAIGYDMASEPLRRAAMQLAMASRLPTASAPVTLKQEIDGHPQSGVLIYHYLDGGEAGAPAGFVYSPVRMGDLFASAFAGQSLAFEMIARDAAAPEPPLFQTAGYTETARLAHSAAQTMLEVGGREWIFEARANAPVAFLSGHRFTLITALAMIMLSMVTALARQAQRASVDRARALNQVQAQSMREKDLHLREMSHRMKNSLTRVVAIARQAARGTATKDEFVQSLNQRLRAMADAQDMLTRSGSGTTDLRQLLASELSQIGSDRADFATLEGQSLQLDARETQALGLSFHELATNALKYGAGAVEGAQLVISWQVQAGPSGRVLHLIWDEATGTPLPAPTRKGFGSQLLDSCIQLELGGQITRDFHETGLTVKITVPLAKT